MYVVYHIGGGNFATTNGPAPESYSYAYPVTEEQNQLIEQGAELFLQDDALVIAYEVEPGFVFAEVIE